MQNVTAQDVRNTLEKTQTLFCQWVQGVESQLAEAEKPKLRHWDLGYDEDSGDEFVVIEQRGLFGSPKAFYGDQKGQVHVNESIGFRVRIGNLTEVFADLKARQEPLEHFRVCGLDVGLNEMGNIQLTNDDKDTLYIHSDDWHTFILNLQRLVYTAEASK